MTDLKTSAPHPAGWGTGAVGTDPLDQLVHLSRLMGQDTRLVQPGGGNTSTKVGDILLVKGSGTDLRTITREGFSQLSLSRLAALRDAEAMSDAEMMRFMAGCMLAEGPAPSVETPLHSLLPQRVIAHTHDVATMSLTNVRDAVAERLVGELFQGRIVYVPYVRPGFPLAQTVGRLVGRGTDGRAGGRTGGRTGRSRRMPLDSRWGTTDWWSGQRMPRSVTPDWSRSPAGLTNTWRQSGPSARPSVRPSARPTSGAGWPSWCSR